jgi:hypothetical protein
VNVEPNARIAEKDYWQQQSYELEHSVVIKREQSINDAHQQGSQICLKRIRDPLRCSCAHL